MPKRITVLNKGGLFELGLQVVKVVNLEKDDTDAEYLLLLKFKAINVTDEILLIAIKGALPGCVVDKTHDSYMVSIVRGSIENKDAYLESLANRMIEVLKASIEGWGQTSQHDGQFMDDYHNLN